MDDSTKIACAIVTAAVILVSGYVVYHEVARRRDIDQANAVLQSISSGVVGAVKESQAEQSADQAVAQAQRLRRLEAQEAEDARRMLGSNQRCVGGVVIQVSGASYSQLGSISDPVHCSGQVADRALR